MIPVFSRRISDQMNIIVQAPIAIAFLDNNLRYVAHSKKWCDDYGIGYTDLKGMHHYEVFPEIIDEWKKVHQEVLQGREDSEKEEVFNRKDGSTQWIKWSTKPWHDYDGNIAGIVIVSEDITELVKKRQRDQRNYDLLFQTCTKSNIGTWEYNNVTGDLFWSEATKAIHEVPENYQPTAENALQFYKEGDSRKNVTEAFIKGLTHGGIYDLELEVVTAKGTPIWVRAVGISEFLNGVCIKVYGTLEDITRRKMHQF